MATMTQQPGSLHSRSLSKQNLIDENAPLTNRQSPVSTIPLLRDLPKSVRLFRISPSRINRLVRRVGYTFLPQLLRSKIYHDFAPAEQIRDTSWLDGMRGYAAIIIFDFHFTSGFSDMSQQPWGDEKHRYLVELPVIRVLHSAMPPYIFFMSTGYSLSIKALQLMRDPSTSSHARLLQVLSGSAFRRLIRLLLPTIAIMLIVSMLAYVGMFEPFRQTVLDPKNVYPTHPGRGKTPPPQFDNLYDQLYLIREELSTLVNFFTWDHFYPTINGALWTIRVELRGSIMMYAVLLILARCRESVRLICLMGCMLYYLRWEKLEDVSYIWGAIVAQIYVMRQPRGEKAGLVQFENASHFSKLLPVLSRCRPLLTELRTSQRLLYKFLRLCFVVACVCGPFYLMTCPMHKSELASGYKLLTSLTPKVIRNRGEFISLVGNCLIVLIWSWSTPGSSLDKVFANSVALYLGRIMFGVYLLHTPIFYMLGYGLPHVLWAWMEGWGSSSPNDSIYVYVAGMAAGMIVTAIPTLWLADVFTREVIGRCFMAAFWVESLCYVKTE